MEVAGRELLAMSFGTDEMVMPVQQSGSGSGLPERRGPVNLVRAPVLFAQKYRKISPTTAADRRHERRTMPS